MGDLPRQCVSFIEGFEGAGGGDLPLGSDDVSPEMALAGMGMEDFPNHCSFWLLPPRFYGKYCPNAETTSLSIAIVQEI